MSASGTRCTRTSESRDSGTSESFAADGVSHRVNRVLRRTVAEYGQVSAEVRVTPSRSEISPAPREHAKGQRIREVTSAVQKRFGFPRNSVKHFAEFQRRR